MITPILKNSFVLLLLLSTLSCAKKGADDPAISLRSRKARVVGDWTLESGSDRENVSGPNSFSNYYAEYGENSYTSVSEQSTNNPNKVLTINKSGTFSGSMKFDKDGNFTWDKYMETSEPQNRSITGKWNFTSSVGDRKKKDQLLLTVSNVAEISTKGVLTNTEYMGSKLFYIFDILELRTKKLVLLREFTSFADVNGTETFFAEKFSYKQ